MSSEDPLATSLATQQQGSITSCCTENEPAIHQEPTQQHGEVRAGKRSRDLEGEIDGPASKKANYDTTDGSRRADESQPCTIEAIVRRGWIPEGGKDGKLLKAINGTSDGGDKLDVDFKGTDQDNPTSVFHLEQRHDKDGNALRYTVKDDNYYLRVYSGDRVRLRKLREFPINDKYFFRIEHVKPGLCPSTIESLATKKYLCCDKDGNAFMEEAGQAAKVGMKIKDRRMWFCCQLSDMDTQQDDYQF